MCVRSLAVVCVSVLYTSVCYVHACVSVSVYIFGGGALKGDPIGNTHKQALAELTNIPCTKLHDAIGKLTKKLCNQLAL